MENNQFFFLVENNESVTFQYVKRESVAWCGSQHICNNNSSNFKGLLTF